MIDHLRNTQSFGLEDLQGLVLDEADRLLAMGFADEVWASSELVCLELSSHSIIYTTRIITIQAFALHCYAMLFFSKLHQRGP